MLPRVAKLWYIANMGCNTHTYNNADPEIVESFARKAVELCIDTIAEYGIHGSELIIADLREQFNIQDE